MKKKIGKFEAAYLSIIIFMLLAFLVAMLYQHFMPIFFARELKENHRERIKRLHNYEINDEDWETFNETKEIDVRKKMFDKWKKERNERK